MAAAVAATTPPTADNRCVGGGEPSAVTMRHQTVVPLPSSDIPALTSSGRWRRRLGGNDSNPQVSRSSTSSCSSSPVSSSDDDEDDDNDGGHGGMDGAKAEFGGRGVVGVQPPPVAAKRLKDLQQHLVDLDDLELLDRHLAVENATGNSLHDSASDGGAATGMVAEELRQKNKDLVLAARLGKALLAKNDELSLMNERLAEEYGDKLEEIEQDRHRLRRQLAQARAECEQRCHELQADLRDLQAVLDSRERQLREADKQKRAVVRELTDQNGRLQSHIRELSQAEAELRHKCRLLEDAQQPQHGSGKWTGIGGVGSPASITNGGSTTDYGSLTPDDYRSLDVLRDEIDMKAAEKQRLQKRMAELRADRDRLAELLELKDRQLAECRAEANHYEHRSAMLAKQLDDALCSGSAGDWRGRGGKCASCGNGGGATTASRTNGSGGTESQPMSLLAELEQAEAASTQTAAGPPPPMVDVDLTEHRPKDPNDFGTDAERLVTRLCDALERRAGQADAVSPELSASTRYRLLKLMGCGGSGVGDGSTAAGGKSTGAVDLAELVRNRDGRVAELTCELSVRDAELQAAREERDLAVRDKMDAMRIQCARCGDAGSGEAADATSGSGTDEKDASLIPELLRKAWEQRDGAVRRKNAVQVQLARTRVDVLQANGQLMEAIGQKVELSQQLEQWQMDMQALLDEQMRRKLLAPPVQSSAAGTPEFGGGNQQKFSSAGGFPSMSASSLGSLGSSGLMNSLLMIAGGGGNANR